ncbi:hypothetical protein C4577_03805, partial [Candidatus Parcubacteria bacterium]
MKKYRFAIIVALILFVIPFFWLSPGEMNLGGDSGRLYFYDPATYLNLRVLYNYLGSGFGTELTYYIYFPYVMLLFLLKLIFQSPTVLISFFNGLTLSVAFFFVYLFLKELLKRNENNIKQVYVEISSILGGLFYILSQISIYSGWEKPIITFNQVFLNPFMAYILLKFMLTQKMKYLTIALLTTFIFTPNFSIVGAPPFFAFYPITIVFLFLYARFICKVSFKWKFFIIGIILFLLIHSFHLTNTVQSIFSPGSSYNQTVFAPEGTTGSRNAVSYFVAVAGTVKASLAWMGLSQFQDKPYYVLFIIFPVILVASFLLNKGKTLLLTGLFFLVFFYFSSAITEIGFFIYKQLFKVPGFSMFRNFHAQWSYVFFFFYSLLLGQALATVANKLSRRSAFLLFTVFGIVIVGFGFPLLTGSVAMPKNPETGVRNSFQMDPVFEQYIQSIKSNPIDGKVMMFPLTGPGYQLLQGREDGFYRGLPMISYLGGKSEFGGYETMGVFKDIFLTSMKNNDQKTLKKLLSMMNVRWLFYNSDQYVYDKQFKSLYSFVSEYAPRDQEEYKDFIKKMPVVKIADFGKFYHVYSVREDIYLPHIFSTVNTISTNDAISLIFDSNFQKDVHQAVISVQYAVDEKAQMILYGVSTSLLSEIKDNSHLHRHMPFVNRKPDDMFYFLAVAREEFDLFRTKDNPNQYLNYSLFLLSKRIQEMESFGVQMAVVKDSIKTTKTSDLNKLSSYNSWNSSIYRYEKQFDELIRWINESKASEKDRALYKIKVNEQLYQHEIRLLRSLNDLNKENKEKEYLYTAVNDMFKRYYEKVDISIINPYLYTYSLPAYVNRKGKYK